MKDLELPSPMTVACFPVDEEAALADEEQKSERR